MSVSRELVKIFEERLSEIGGKDPTLRLGSIADLLGVSVYTAWNLKNHLEIPANSRGRQPILITDEIKFEIGHLYERGLSERDIAEQMPEIGRKRIQNILKELGVVKRARSHRKNLSRR